MILEESYTLANGVQIPKLALRAVDLLVFSFRVMNEAHNLFSIRRCWIAGLPAR